MTRTKTKGVKVDAEWAKKAKDIMQLRLQKGLAKFNQQELGLPEFTRLSMKAPSWKKVEEELKSLPKRENLK